MNKKGAVTDAIYVPMYLLLVVITTFVALYVWFSFQTNFTVLVNDTPYNVTITTAMNEIQIGLASIDYMFPLLVIGLMLTSLIFAYKTGAGVIYAILSFILWGVALMMSLVFTNIFGQFESTFPSIATFVPIMAFFMNNMKYWVLFWVFLISVVMFTRNKKEEQMPASEMVYGSSGW